MKKVISALTAAAMTVSMSASVISAFAYTADEIGFYLKVTSAGSYTVSDDGKTITFATAEDAAGATFTVSSYLSADVSNPAIGQIGNFWEASNPMVHLPESGVSINRPIKGAEEKTYTTADGREFTTKLVVNPFGYIDATGDYAAGVGDMQFVHSNNYTWEYSGNEQFGFVYVPDFANPAYPTPNDTAHFISATSDTFALTSFDVTLDAAITDGTYAIDFIEGYYLPSKDVTQVMTFLADTQNHEVHPTNVTGIKILVGDSSQQPDTSEPDTSEPDTSEPDTSEPDTTPTDPITSEKTHDKGFEWYVEDTTYDPAVGGQINVDVKIWDDPGTNGYEFVLAFDGKTVDQDDCPFKVVAIKDPIDAYEGMTMFVPNYPTGKIGASESGEGEDEAGTNGGVACRYVLEVKEGATLKGAGEKYEVTIANSVFTNAKYDKLEPTLTSGYITILGEEPDTSEPDTSEPDTSEPDTSEPDTSEPDTSEPDTSTPTPGDYLYGDVDKNGKVQLVDIVMLNRYLTGYDNQDLDDYQVVVANCSRSGESDAETKKEEHLNGQDSIEILKYLIGLVSSLPNNA